MKFTRNLADLNYTLLESLNILEGKTSKDRFRELARFWYGPGRAAEFPYKGELKKIGDEYGFDLPEILYRGVHVPKDKFNESQLLDYAGGLRSWSKNIKHAKYYAAGYDPEETESVEIVYIWVNPRAEEVVDTDRIRKEIRMGKKWFGDKGEFILEMPRDLRITKTEKASSKKNPGSSLIYVTLE